MTDNRAGAVLYVCLKSSFILVWQQKEEKNIHGQNLHPRANKTTKIPQFYPLIPPFLLKIKQSFIKVSFENKQSLFTV